MANSLDKKVSKNGLIYSLIALTAVGIVAFTYLADFGVQKENNYITQEESVTKDYLSCGR